MPKLPIFTIKQNVPYDFVKQFATPFERESEDYGRYYCYTFEHEGKRYYVNAGQTLHDKIESLGAQIGETITIHKNTSSGKTRWEVSKGASSSSGGKSVKVDPTSIFLETWDELKSRIGDRISDPVIFKDSVTTIFIGKMQLLQALHRDKTIRIANPLKGEEGRLEDENPDDLPF